MCQILFEVVTRTLVRSLAGLNRLTVRPDLADAAEPFCGTADLHVYKIELWGHDAGAINYDQPRHRDDGNHTPVVPKLAGSHAQMTAG